MRGEGIVNAEPAKADPGACLRDTGSHVMAWFGIGYPDYFSSAFHMIGPMLSLVDPEA